MEYNLRSFILLHTCCCIFIWFLSSIVIIYEFSNLSFNCKIVAIIIKLFGIFFFIPFILKFNFWSIQWLGIIIFDNVNRWLSTTTFTNTSPIFSILPIIKIGLHTRSLFIWINYWDWSITFYNFFCFFKIIFTKWIKFIFFIITILQSVFKFPNSSCLTQ